MLLVSQKGTVFTIQRINVILKEIKRKYRLKVKNFSFHSLRKTFGRLVYNMNSENSELALVKLMELFNHSSLAITKRYLGLRQEEILETYDCLTFWFARRHFLSRNTFIRTSKILSPNKITHSYIFANFVAIPSYCCGKEEYINNKVLLKLSS